MEGASMKVYKGLKGYWKRRKYEKLNGSSSRRRMNRIELGSPRRKRFWQIKITPKLKLVRRIPSPKKLLLWLRDAYMKMMMGFANSRVFSTSYGGAISNDGMANFGKSPLKEYDEKMIVQIYKSILMAQGQLVAREALNLRSEIFCRR